MKIVLVGHDSAERAVLEEALVGRGHRVRHGEADEAALCSQWRPSLVVLLAPDETSPALCRRLRAERACEAATVLAVVPRAESWRLAALVEAGIDDYVLAPLDPERLDARLALAERAALDRQQSRRVKNELEARVRQQKVVSELGRRALAGTDLQAIMDYAAAATAEALEVGFCRVLERLPDGRRLLLRAGVGWDAELLGRAVVDIDPATQAGATLLSGDPVVVEDLGTDRRFRVPPMLQRYGIVSGMNVVIAGETGAYGVLSVHTAVRHAFRPDDVHFLQAVANVLAALIDRTRAEEALRESEAKARAIVETTIDGVITIDETGHIESFNRAAERIFGYSAAEVMGQNVSILMPSPYSEEHDGYLHNYRETGRRKIIGIGREAVGLRKNGETFPLDLAVNEVQLNGRRIFTGILRDITDRRKLEHEILEISEQERRRIGQDLHDGLGQMLTGIGLISRNIGRRMEAGEAVSIDEVNEVTELIREADQYARGLARVLVPVELDAGGLAAALQRLSGNARRLFGINCTFEELGTALMYNNTAATHLYRIAQEAVSNAVKHGRASDVTITLAAGDEQVRLRVDDNGIGFPDVLGENRGMGVRIMHHRARIIGASLDIRRLPEGGTVVTCTMPRPGPSSRTRNPRPKARKVAP